MEEFKIESKEALLRISHALSFRFPIVSFLLSVALLLKIFLFVSFSNYLFVLISLVAFSALSYDFISRKIKNPTPSQIINSYFALLCFDAIILTLIIYFLGGVTWFGFVFYAFYFYPLFILLPRNYAFLYFIYCTFLYSLLVVGQFFEILPYQNIFGFEERIYQKQSFVLTSLVAAVATLWSLGYFGDFPSRLLGKKIKELQGSKILLEQERSSLEEKVKGRTKELEEARKNLGNKVQQRTKELQEKSEKLVRRVKELERFHKVVVGREVKMAELKKEITRLKRLKK